MWKTLYGMSRKHHILNVYKCYILKIVPVTKFNYLQAKQLTTCGALWGSKYCKNGVLCVGRCHHLAGWTRAITYQQNTRALWALNSQLSRLLSWWSIHPESGRSWVQFPAGTALFGTHTKNGYVMLTKFKAASMSSQWSNLGYIMSL